MYFVFIAPRQNKRAIWTQYLRMYKCSDTSYLRRVRRKKLKCFAAKHPFQAMDHPKPLCFQLFEQFNFCAFAYDAEPEMTNKFMVESAVGLRFAVRERMTIDW